MLIFKILDKFIEDEKKGIELLYSYDEDQIENFVNDVTSFYYYLKNGLPYSLKYTEKELYSFLYQIIGCKGLNFNMRYLILFNLGLHNDKRIILELLDEVVNYPLTKILEKDNYNIDTINGMIKEIFDKNDDKTLEIVRKYINGNKILRGNKTFDVIDKLVVKNENLSLEKFILDIYLKDNINSTEHIINLLGDYKYLDLLSPEICIIAQQKVEGDEKLTNDLADFFINNLDFGDRRFNPFIRWGYQNLSADRRRRRLNYDIIRNVRIGDQNVHLLDSNRTAFLEWLSKESKDFDEIKKTDERYQNYEKLCKEIDNNTDKNVIKSLQVITTNKTLLRVNGEGLNSVYSNDGIIEWKLVDIYNRILFIIANYQYKNELKVRLIEELIDMSGTCFSGHFNRLSNVFAGIEEGVVIINKDKEIKKMIKINLQDIIDKAEEKIQDAILLKSDEDYPTEIKEYIKRETSLQLEKMMEDAKEETDLPRLFKESVNEYFMSQIY